MASSSRIPADPSLSFRPDFAVDGDPRTFWEAELAPYDLMSDLRQFFTLDLLNDSLVSQLHILFGQGYPANFSIESAKEDLTWETIANGIRGFDGDEGTVVVKLAEPKCARFIRLLLHGRGNEQVSTCYCISFGI
jgi:hypothetical protein